MADATVVTTQTRPPALGHSTPTSSAYQVGIPFCGVERAASSGARARRAESARRPRTTRRNAPQPLSSERVRPNHSEETCCEETVLMRQLQSAADGNSGGSSSGGSAVIMLVVGVSVALAVLAAWWLWRLSRYRWHRARSAKVLDEIEMEFVNDDADLFVQEDESELNELELSGVRVPSSRYCSSLHASVFSHSCRIGVWRSHVAAALLQPQDNYVDAVGPFTGRAVASGLLFCVLRRLRFCELVCRLCVDSSAS